MSASVCMIAVVAAVSTLVGALFAIVLSLLSTRGLARWPALIPLFRRMMDVMRAVRPAIIKAPGEYDETLLAGMDFLLDEMAKRDMTAILYLNNFWQWSGGMSQYVSWFTGKPVFDPDVTNEWNPFMENSASFYRLEEAQKLYRDVIKAIITRKNTINGKLYSDLIPLSRPKEGQQYAFEVDLDDLDGDEQILQ